ncbi:MAG: DUF4349 domain-containing protein [Defluviitaleaceae bacterium]|nr:DUF4349 domain-containing protein [Defluviitaleaceae bacterium]
MINRSKKFRTLRLTLSLLAIALVLFLPACAANNGASQPNYSSQDKGAALSGAGSAPYDASAETSYYAENSVGFAPEMPAPNPAAAPDYNSGSGVASADQKIIMTGSVNMQSDDFDGVSSSLRGLPAQYGGYIESSSLSQYQGAQRYFSVTMRVPRDNYESLKTAVEALGKVTSSSESSQDATSQYTDLQNSLQTQQIEEERVLAMIDKAQNVDDLLALEQRLGEIRTNIDVYQSQMTNIDRLADYSTLTVYLQEVTPVEMRLVADNLGGRIRESFVNSANGVARFFQNALVFLAGAAIWIAVIAILAAAGITGVKFYRNRNKLAK